MKNWCWSGAMKGIRIWLQLFLPTVPMFLGVLTCSLCVCSQVLYHTEQNSKEYFICVLVLFCCDKHCDLKQLRKSTIQHTTYNLSPREVRKNSEHTNWNKTLKPTPESDAVCCLADGLGYLVSLYSSGSTAQGMVLPRVGLEIINIQDNMTKIYS